MTKQVTPQLALCIDWETSGATWGGDSSKEFQGLTFGAVVFNTQTFEVVETLYREIKFKDTFKWSEEAQKIHGKSQEYLAEHGVEQEEAAADLLELILKFWGPSNKVMFLGHNPEFDRRFTNQLTKSVGIEFSVEASGEPCDGRIELHHVLLDTSALGFITMGLFKSDLLFEAVGLEARGEHNALDDALYTVETCKRIRLLVDTALGK